MKRYNVPDYITAEEIKKFRKKLGMTQKKFAELLGVSKPTVERWDKKYYIKNIYKEEFYEKK